MKPLVSVIIPALNEEAYLPLLLADLSAQKEKDFEVIVVDCGSDDSTVEKAKSFEESLNIHVIVAKKKNVSFQRNLGAQHAKGSYVFFLDADFRLGKTFFKVLYDRLEETKYLMLVPSLAAQQKSLHNETYTKVSSLLSEMSHTLNNPYVPSSTLLVQRDFFLFLEGYNENIAFGEDQEIVQRAFRNGVKTKLLHEPSVEMSFRRFEKYGSFNIYAKYIIGVLFTNSNSQIEEKIFEYDMGGHLYKDKKKTQEEDAGKKIEEIVNEQFEGLKLRLNKVLKLLSDL